MWCVVFVVVLVEEYDVIGCGVEEVLLLGCCFIVGIVV